MIFGYLQHMYMLASSIPCACNKIGGEEGEGGRGGMERGEGREEGRE